VCRVPIFVFSCHEYIVLGPSLISIYGMRGGRQKAFTYYSPKNKALKDVKWSKERLFKMLGKLKVMKNVLNKCLDCSQLWPSMESKTHTLEPLSLNTFNIWDWLTPILLSLNRISTLDSLTKSFFINQIYHP